MENRDLNSYLIFLKYFRNQASEQESKELLAWLEEKKEHREQYFLAKRIWTESIKDEATENRTDHSWERLEYRLFGSEKNNKPGRLRRNPDWKVYSLVASVAILLMFSVFMTLRLDSIKNFSKNVNRVEVPFGSRTNITLPDGTRVWLNSGSKLSYAQSFFTKNREVELNGEAYFDVAKHMGSTFIVHTNDLEIKALGTQFNVKAYPDDNIVETYLVEGKVVVDHGIEDSQFESVTLRPSQKLTYVKEESVSITEQKTGTENEAATQTVARDRKESEKKVKIALVRHPETDISWKDEKLVIRSETLASMSRKLERFYNITIEFADNEVKEYMFSGTLDEVTIDEVMKAISSTAPVKYDIHKNKVTIRTGR